MALVHSIVCLAVSALSTVAINDGFLRKDGDVPGSPFLIDFSGFVGFPFPLLLPLVAGGPEENDNIPKKGKRLYPLRGW